MKQTRPVIVLCSDFRTTYVQILVSDQTVVGLLSRILCNLWTDRSAILPSDQSVVQPIFELACDLWSDCYATLPSDETVARLQRFSDHVFWVTPRHQCATQMIFIDRSRVTHTKLGDIPILPEKCVSWKYFKSVVWPKKLCGHSATQKTYDQTNVWLKSLWSDYLATETVRASLVRPKVCTILVQSTLSLIRPYSKLYIAIKPLRNTL